jgi:hypothetical protein
VVKAEDSRPRGPGFNPPLWRPFSGTIHLDQSLEQKLWKTLTWHCCICCNPANGRVDFEEWSAYKIQLHGIEIKLFPVNSKFNYYYHSVNLITFTLNQSDHIKQLPLFMLQFFTANK